MGNVGILKKKIKKDMTLKKIKKIKKNKKNKNKKNVGIKKKLKKV